MRKLTILFACSALFTGAVFSDATMPAKGYEAAIKSADFITRTNQQHPLSDQKNQGNWVLNTDFSDEFETDKLDIERWWPNNPGWKGRPPTNFHGSNVSIDNGELVFKINQHGDTKLPEGYTHTSGFIKSRNDILYGYFESEAKLMDAPWVSGFWLNKVTKQWWTEIDINENCPCQEGLRHNLNSNVHIFRSPADKGGIKKLISSPKKYFFPVELNDDYHVWGLEWNKEVIRFFIDGVMFREVKNVHWHQPLEINLNNETNKWLGAVPDDTRIDKEYRVKYVRVWTNNK
ncbi:MAG: family 16 glycosylhydrolase [Thalassotalea sp.]